MNTKVYPRTNDFQTIYLNTVIKNPAIIVGDYTIYNDFINDPLDFEKNNVLYHYPINKDRLIIGKFCSVACGTKFLFILTVQTSVLGTRTEKVNRKTMASCGCINTIVHNRETLF